LQDLLPGIINQLGPDNLSHLKKIAQQVSGARLYWCLAGFWQTSVKSIDKQS